MAETFLVDLDRKVAEMIVDEVDRRSFDVPIIVLAKFDTYYEGRLVLASPSFSENEFSFHYMRLHSILREIGQFEDATPLLLLNMNDPFVLDLRSTFGSVERTNGLRLTDQAIGGRFIEEGYIFRIR